MVRSIGATEVLERMPATEPYANDFAMPMAAACSLCQVCGIFFFAKNLFDMSRDPPPVGTVLCADGRAVAITPHAHGASPLLAASAAASVLPGPTLDSVAVTRAMRFYDHYGQHGQPPAPDAFAHALLEPGHLAALVVMG